jgi:hypothetical protein
MLSLKKSYLLCFISTEMEEEIRYESKKRLQSRIHRE